jgi:hypothetical protein
MPNEARILQNSDLDSILQFEQELLKNTIEDQMEREMSSWHAPWRRESLEHYLPQGWSFGVFNQKELVGYFLAQPQLFVRGMTQSLWVEHLNAHALETRLELVDIARRLCREKHFQMLYILNPDHSVESIKTAKFE